MDPNRNIRTELIEVVVLNIGVREFSLGQLPNLRNAKNIIQIEAYSVAQVSVAPSTRAVINAAVFAKSFLKLIDSNNTEFRTMPLLSLSKTVNGTAIPELNVPTIDTEKSKIVVGNTTGLALDEAFLLAITYEK